MLHPGSSDNIWSAICINICFVTSTLLPVVPKITRGLRPGPYACLLKNGDTLHCLPDSLIGVRAIICHCPWLEQASKTLPQMQNIRTVA